MQISNELIEIIASCADANEVSLRTDYSGRGMYGHKCIGLDGSFHGIMTTLGDITNELHENALDDVDNGEDLFQEWMEFAFNFSMDSMGLGQIVYWSNIEAPEGFEVEEEDEDY